MRQYQCLEDRCLIRPFKVGEEKTEGGIIDPNLKQKPVLKGEVVSVGEGFTARDTGVFIPTRLHRGDIVLFGSGAGMEIEIDKEEGGKETVRIMREGDVFLLISRKKESE